MNPEKSHLLHQLFPGLFQAGCTIDCQDGWFKLLLDLGAALQRSHAEDPAPLPLIQRITQHRGILAISFQGGSRAARRLIREAQQHSCTICELDGMPAVGLYVCAPYWFRHLCRRCAELHGCMTIDDMPGHELCELPDCCSIYAPALPHIPQQGEMP